MAIVALPLSLPLDSNRPRQWWAGEFDGLAPAEGEEAGDGRPYDFAVVIALRDPTELAVVRLHLERLLGRMSEETEDV